MNSTTNPTTSPHTETPQPRRHIALSPSRIADYQQCPLLYRFRAIDRLPEPSTVAQVKGTLVHAVLEDMHSWPREERNFRAAALRIEPIWQQMCAEDPSLLELVPEADTRPFLVECWKLVRGYFEMENPQGFDAHACEMFVDTTLPNGVPVRGFIDRVDIAPTGEVRVVDYKTGKKPIPRFSETARNQMLFYALVYWRLFEQIPHQLRLMYLKVNDSMFLTPSPEQLEFFERDLLHLWEKIQSDGKTGDFRPNTSKLCGWCAHQDKCPEFGGTPPEYPGWPNGSSDQTQGQQDQE